MSFALTTAFNAVILYANGQLLFLQKVLSFCSVWYAFEIRLPISFALAH